MLSGILDLIFPPRCVVCRTLLKHGEVLCHSCRKKITIHATFFCGRCRLRLPEGKKVCHKDTPYLLGAATDYHGPAKKLIHALKFDLVQDAAEELGSLLSEYSARVNFEPQNDLVIPIPLSRQRRRERGFNQAEQIARSLATRLGLELCTAPLCRIRQTPAQSKTASLHERIKNVAGCFSADPEIVRGRNILLIDDVVTSGATLLEAAKALKAAGADTITALVAAKA
jgi:competence protein ComFC